MQPVSERDSPIPQKGDLGMPKVAAFHSRDPKIPLHMRRHHDNSRCWDGNNVERYYWTPGTGGYPRCHVCTTLAAQGR